MVGSARAAIAADTGRGESVSALPKDYRVVLPPLPAGEAMNRVVVLHCDVAGRPYRIDDFRQPLKDAGVIKEVCGIGAYQMSHVWLINFRTDDAKKKLLENGPLIVKGRPCLVIDPVRHELRVKLHWVAFNVTNEMIRKIFTEYGDVKEVTSDKWRVQDFESSDSTTRIVRLVLREGVTPDRLPHQLRLGPGTALVAVPGRAPMCLRCHRAGHIRRECRVPRCTECHAFGHEQADCTRSYARAVGRGLEGDNSELVMDEEEAEGAAAPATPEPKPTTPEPETGGPNSGKDESKALMAADSGVLAAESSVTVATATKEENAGTTEDGSEEMVLEVQPNKRRHEEGSDATDEPNQRKPEPPWQAGRGKKTQRAATQPGVLSPKKGGTKIT